MEQLLIHCVIHSCWYIYLQYKVNKWYTTKLQPVPINLTKCSNAVDADVAKKVTFIRLIENEFLNAASLINNSRYYTKKKSEERDWRY